ncbi:hypothetical protein [Conexibacter sp. SYSU D00693]|uniref:hypothetical protein n=1 Tax=Conexibacter sp. SYSU D00693 TaxID=2812560 RepID=UPI00196B4DBC|nr:hypothetical protein [Conexibacter sp. SYSU D00693]
MRTRRIAIIAAAVAAVAAGSAGAIAATTKDEAKQREDAVLSDAAKRLDVAPEDLRNALSAAQDAQIDQAVKDGKLTQEQADAIKAKRKDSGLVLGGPRGGRAFGPGGPGFGPHGKAFGAFRGVFEDAAKALGLSPAELKRQLADGRTPAQIARAQGKDLDEVKAAVKESATDRLDQAVKDGDLTDAQRDRIVRRLDEAIDRLADGRVPRFGRGGRGGPGHGWGGPPPGLPGGP